MAQRKTRSSRRKKSSPESQRGFNRGKAKRSERAGPGKAPRVARALARGSPAVVGIGASAGGLDAVTELLAGLPSDTGLAFIFVQHLDPRHKSSLVEILSRATEMPVVEARDGATLAPNHVYVKPPDRDLAIFRSVMRLVVPPTGGEHRLAIDRFFASLADDFDGSAVGVILSGTASDGALGLRAVQASGGITMVQEPETARYDGMPRNAIAAGHVDYILPPRAIGWELAKLARHGFRGVRIAAPAAGSHPTLDKILMLLRSSSGVDFGEYKRSTVERRISRRMALHAVESLEHYVELLARSTAEVSALFEDMLITVTEFFRDSEALEALRHIAFPRLTAGRSSDTPVRIWIPACSSGEEVYSLAIALQEYCQENDRHQAVQLFATDVSDAAIERARAGRYPVSIASQVSEARLRRFFTKSSDGYQVAKGIRDTCIFARQNVARDPPFSKVDLISCRNLLIYLGPGLQKRVIPTFHYALNENGFLLLGASESIGTFGDLFALADRKQQLYVKKAGFIRLPTAVGARAHHPLPVETPSQTAQLTERGASVSAAADQELISRYTPSGFLIDENHNVVEFRGETGAFVAPADGAATFALMKLLRCELTPDVRAALLEAQKTKKPVSRRGVSTTLDGVPALLNIDLVPVRPARHDDYHYLVLFERLTGSPTNAPMAAIPGSSAPEGSGADATLAKLREEVAESKRTMQAFIEEHESTVEELWAANEEIQSSNEELQSTNEELETAKEELQSANEELTTMNEELDIRNTELTRVLNDLDNHLASVDLPIVTVGNDLRIRTLTQAATRVLKIIPADIGRPIGELKLARSINDIEGMISDIVDALEPRFQDIRSDDGRWYSMCVRPYRTSENLIDGAVIALNDITERVELQNAIEASRNLAQSIIDAVREPLVVLSSSLSVVNASRSFYRQFAVQPAETEGRALYELGDGQWNIPALRELFERVVHEQTTFDDFEVVHEFPRVGPRRVLLNARQIETAGEPASLILLAMEVSDVRSYD